MWEEDTPTGKDHIGKDHISKEHIGKEQPIQESTYRYRTALICTEVH
jgi:hypothetical protein